MEYYPKQIELSDRGLQILKKHHIVYYAFQMRVGKTLTALRTAEMIGAKKVLFVTKKKAIKDVLKDFNQKGYKDMALTVINYESVHKCEKRYDLVIIDEAHSLKSYPKPSERTRNLKAIVKDSYLILLSGTPTPEGFSGIYHQLWISDFSPFAGYKNFYKWAHQFVTIKQKYFNGSPHNDYTEAKVSMIEPYLKPIMLTCTQAEADFEQTDLKERIIRVKIYDGIHKLAEHIKKHRYFRFKDGNELVCDTAVSLQNKLHQIYSGTVIVDGGLPVILDESKAKYIVDHFKPPYAVYYKYKAEELALKHYIDSWTDDPQDFNNGKADVFLSQVRSGAMGINISRANTLIAYNIDFSSELYWQMRARIQAKDKTDTNEIIWLFSDGGIEDHIYKAVQSKKNYTVRYFKKDYEVN